MNIAVTNSGVLLPAECVEAMEGVLGEVGREHVRQLATRAVPQPPLTCGACGTTDRTMADGTRPWAALVLEQVAEALAASDSQTMRGELVRLAALWVHWVEAIDTNDTAHRG